MPPDQLSLKQRLLRVQALHDGATTPGERQAASQAVGRLVARLRKLRADDPVAAFVREHVDRLGVDRAPEPPAVPLPSKREVAAALTRWESGDWSTDDVGLWACGLIGAVDLPSDPNALGAVRAEVLLQLAMLDRVPLRASDVSRIRRFLRTREWGGWFELLAEAAVGGRQAVAV